jgi:FkbM family methyltransferase
VDLLGIARQVLGDGKISFFDVGSRNGIWELARLAPIAKTWGFEPNEIEYIKLVESKTDSELMYRMKPPVYYDLEYVNCALSERSGMGQLYVTEGPGACSLLEPNINSLGKFPYMFGGVDFISGFRVTEKSPVVLSTLDDVVEEKGVEYIDYLKLDTQGTELKILKGSKDLLSRHGVSVIKCEVLFQELYKEQSYFSDIDQFLRENGFMLMDIRFGSEHTVSPMSQRFPGDRGVLAWGDAFYCLEIDLFSDEKMKNVKMRALKCGFALMDLGYPGRGFEILKRAAGLGLNELEVIRHVLEEVPFRRKIRDFAKKITPPGLAPFLGKLFPHRG